MENRLLVLLAVILICCGHSRGSPVIDDMSIMTVTRDDQTSLLKQNFIKKEVGITEIVFALINFRQVDENGYLKFAHSTNQVSGSVQLKDGTALSWTLEPNYALVVKDNDGKKQFYLAPRLVK